LPIDQAKAPWHPAAGRLQQKREYVLGELLQFGDADFVDVAYRTVLRRPPDTSGYKHYLALLRTGALTKVDILGQLRWSPEGLARSVHIDGLLVPYTLQRWRRKRLVGPVLSWMHSFARLGALSERQIKLDAAHAHEAQGVGRALNQMSEQLERQVAVLEERLAEHPDAATFNAMKGELAANVHKLAATKIELARTTEKVLAQDARMAALERKLSITASLVEGLVLKEQQERDAAKSLDQFYSDFEDTFRGERSLVRQRSEPYLEWVKEVGAGSADAPVLDIGCGRGEWLELLRDHGLVGKGVDLNSVFAASCREMGFDIMEGDAIATLRSLPDNSVGAITSMHLVEHLPFEAVISLLDEAKRVLRPGGLIMLETPNPENLSVATHTFYFDPTHRNPLPPEALRWIVGSRGFQDARVERLLTARWIDAPELLSDNVPGAPSINVLLQSMRVAPDYAIVARCP
jgi:O-antigen chain-terminating methyltransferase